MTDTLDRVTRTATGPSEAPEDHDGTAPQPAPAAGPVTLAPGLLPAPEPDHPVVAAVLVVRDEERYLERAVSSLLDQTYAGPLEVVVAVGPSHDRTLELAHGIAARDPRVRVVDNPTGSRSEGLNLAVAAARSDATVVVRCDGHAVLPVGYVRRAVRTMQRTGADVVGGMMVPVGDQPFQRAVARAMSHPAGIGASAFHTGGDEGPASTVYLGVFRRATLERVGGYDPTLVRAEDWDLNRRIRLQGGVVWFDPLLRVVYHPRRDRAALARQFFRTGMWRREVVDRDRSTVSVRYLAPPALVLGLGVGLLAPFLALVSGLAWLALPVLGVVLYALVVLTASAHAGINQPWEVRRVLPVVLVVMHVTWGAGFLLGVTARARTEHRA